MKLSLKASIEALVKRYQSEVTQALAQVKELETSQLYTADAKGQMIREIKLILQKADVEFNKKLNEIIQGGREEVLEATVNKPADYQNMLTNALNQIEMIGDKLTDKAAYELVKPFFGDYETMHNLYAVISNRYGKEGLNVTTRTLGWFDRMLYKLDNLMVGTVYFFNAGTHMALGLNFTIGSDMLLGEAEELDSMAAKMDDLTRFTFKEAEENIKDGE